LPVFPELVKNDPWWNDPKIDPHRPPYVHQAFVEPTTPLFYVYNPAYARVETEHVWGQAMADIMAHGMAPQAANEKAFRRLEEIFAQYPIHQA
jgi:ABC-type glycerol-3-phosphate transport system substrate-binding protein